MTKELKLKLKEKYEVIGSSCREDLESVKKSLLRDESFTSLEIVELIDWINEILSHREDGMKRMLDTKGLEPGSSPEKYRRYDSCPFCGGRKRIESVSCIHCINKQPSKIAWRKQETEYRDQQWIKRAFEGRWNNRKDVDLMDKHYYQGGSPGLGK